MCPSSPASPRKQRLFSNSQRTRCFRSGSQSLARASRPQLVHRPVVIEAPWAPRVPRKSQHTSSCGCPPSLPATTQPAPRTTARSAQAAGPEAPLAAAAAAGVWAGGAVASAARSESLGRLAASDVVRKCVGHIVTSRQQELAARSGRERRTEGGAERRSGGGAKGVDVPWRAPTAAAFSSAVQCVRDTLPRKGNTSVVVRHENFSCQGPRP